MAYNLENPAACLRVIARQIEKGELDADFGVLTLRKKGAARPAVFGFGKNVEPVRECGRAVLEVLRLSGELVPVSRAQVEKFAKLAEKIAA